MSQGFSVSKVIPFNAYVSMRALSRRAHSSAVIFQSIKESSHERSIIADLSKSHGCSGLSLIHSGKSNGFIFSIEFKEIEI